MELTGETRRSSRLWIVCVVIVLGGLAGGVAYMRHVKAIENARLKESLDQSLRETERWIQENDARRDAARKADAR